MNKQSNKKFKAPARRRIKESKRRMTLQSPESVEDSRPKKRKRAKNETPRKRTRVSDVARPSTSCQDQIKTVMRTKRKITKEGHSLPAKKKKGLPEHILTTESSSSTVDITTESSSSRLVINSTETRHISERNLKRKDEDLKEPPRRKKMKKMEAEKERVDSQKAEFYKKYIELYKLGEGGFGSVYAGYREKDKLPVAIKHILKHNVVLKHKVSEQHHLGLVLLPTGFPEAFCVFPVFGMFQDENDSELALEVVIMLKLRTAIVGQPSILFLLDWYDLDQELILVMERPIPAEDLSQYLTDHRGSLKEKEAKIILKQLVEATVHLEYANIFHRDIKVDNILIQSRSEGPRVYLIDFGLSCFDDKKQHQLFCGVPETMPHDWFIHNCYIAGPTTVWQLGVVLFEILHKKLFKTTSFLSNKLKISKRLSKNCQDFLTKCLMVDVEERPTLEELLHHPWFS
ncbi:serine/threonine-protein kinase pim-3-like isoform X2 [Girardinichthys multiradiatus]|uniref:serine/threonine-protein kinase pim-3-like isoform X2 n=1 Tax=Girardinichthys multiradiatus TaxID=208333 RepID=UPI001FAE65C8|nr:serine/threonine-protein kinase pim-3-like isoform X2 [Girardinichthys multiradiatus]